MFRTLNSHAKPQVATMKKSLIVILATLASFGILTQAQSASFTYQGVLKDQLGQALPERTRR
jgi:hypothetical protein